MTRHRTYVLESEGINDDGRVIPVSWRWHCNCGDMQWCRTRAAAEAGGKAHEAIQARGVREIGPPLTVEEVFGVSGDEPIPF